MTHTGVQCDCESHYLLDFGIREIPAPQERELCWYQSALRHYIDQLNRLAKAHEETTKHVPFMDGGWIVTVPSLGETLHEEERREKELREKTNG